MLSKEEITQIFDGFNGLKVLIIGDVMIDSYIFGQVKRLSPEAPVPIVNVQKRENRLGGAANVAKNIQSLGAIPLLCAVVGDDDKGGLFLNLLKDNNMPQEGIVKSVNRPTTVKFRVIGNNAHLLRVDEETDKDITSQELKELLVKIEQMIHNNNVNVIVFEDYDKGLINKELINNTVKLAKSKNIPVVVDPKRKNFLNYTHIDLFKPNFKEFCEGLKVELDMKDEKGVKENMMDFQAKQNIDTILLSLSENGVLFSQYNGTNFHSSRIPAFVRNVADVSGAGDTLISVAALCMALGLKTQTMAALSNLAGGVVCEYVGAIPIDKNRLFEEALKLLCND